MNVILSERQLFQSAIDKHANRGEKLSDPDGKQTRFFETSSFFSIESFDLQHGDHAIGPFNSEQTLKNGPRHIPVMKSSG
jgi:hypothetical protein